MRTKYFKFLVPIMAVLLCVVLLEVSLSFFYAHNSTYFVWWPQLEFKYDLDTKVLRGVSPIAKSKYNSIGAKSEEIGKEHTSKLVVFGGSTTECIVLDQSKTWTQQLQKSLNNRGRSPDSLVWVGNFGKSGNATNEHVLQTQEVLDYSELKDVKYVLYFVGFNDLWKTIVDSDQYVNYNLDLVRRAAFIVVADKDLPWYRRRAIWKFLKRTKYKMRLKKHRKEELGAKYQALRKRRQDVSKTRELPKLAEGLVHYKKNLDSLVSICLSKGTIPVFITQPVLWRPNLSLKSEKILHTFFEGQDNFETETLHESMRIFNEAMIEVAMQRDIPYIDLFDRSEENWFYDDCHFNEKGAEQVAGIIAERMEKFLQD